MSDADRVYRTAPGDVLPDWTLPAGWVREVVEVEPAESYIARKVDGRWYRNHGATERSALYSTGKRIGPKPQFS